MTEDERLWLKSLIQMLNMFGEAHLDTYTVIDWDTQWTIRGETKTLREWAGCGLPSQKAISFSFSYMEDPDD